MKACRGDHRRIVGAHLARGQEDPKALAPRSVGHRGAKRTVRGYATGEADRLRPALEGGTNRLCDEDIDDAGLKGRRDVGSLAKHAVVAWRSHLDEQRVPARYQQHYCRKREIWILEQRGVEVPLEVVDTDERQAGRERERLRCGYTYKERADQSGTDRHRHRVEVPAAVE